MFELIDITDTIIPETEVQYFNEDEFLKLYETCLYLMEEFIQECPSFVSEPDFEDMFDENIQELMYSQFEFDIFYTEDAEDEINFKPFKDIENIENIENVIELENIIGLENCYFVLNKWYNEPFKDILLIIGPTGCGKTSLINLFCKN